jgi:glutamyl-tRNA reductase
VTQGTGTIVGVSIAHNRAGVDDLDQAWTDSQRHAVEKLLEEPEVAEAFALQTCNRVEGYVVADTFADGREALTVLTEGLDEELVVELGHEESLEQLLRVAAGLESLVLGEDQILGQVRDAYEDAQTVGGIGPLLEDAVTKAVHVGERARTETAINDGVVSLASAAVRVADEGRDLSTATGLVVGAGEMGTIAAKALGSRTERLLVANRTISHAEHVLEQAETTGRALGLDELGEAVAEADVIVSATGSPDHVIEREMLADAGETFVVDLAQPRDVPAAASELAGVTIRDLDTLEAVTQRTRRQRERAAERVESIVDNEFDHLLAQYKRKRADKVISAMYESAERTKARQLETALSKLDFDDEETEVVKSMADAIVSELLAAPTTGLRDAAEDDDWETIQTALHLFDPNFGPSEEATPSFVAGMSPEEASEASSEPVDHGEE